MPRIKDSLSRRRWLQQCGGAALYAGLADFMRLHAQGNRAATADSCILLFLNGGMSHVDTFDPKPEQPPEIRGEFQTVRTSVPGVHVTEHVPMLARLAQHWSVVRTVSFEGRLGNHSPACYHMLTGRDPTGEAAVLAPPRPTDHPTMGAAAARMRPTPGTIPAFVMVPDVLIENVFLTPGQFAGWLGSRYEAFRIRNDPSLPTFAVPALAPPTDVNSERMSQRRQLLNEVSAARADLANTLVGRDLDPYYERAFELLTSGRTQAAFRIDAEPDRVRDRYGRNVVGQSLLLARRLVEAGVRFVNVHWPNVGGGSNWDTHSNGFRRLKNNLLPPTDCGVSALIEDLQGRGLLERTLVVVMTEFGRAPYIGRTFQNSGGQAGRDHWSNCFSVVLAGGGTRGGQVVGRSDPRGAFPADREIVPADVVATIFHALGIPSRQILSDTEGRTHRLCDGNALTELW